MTKDFNERLACASSSRPQPRHHRESFAEEDPPPNQTQDTALPPEDSRGSAAGGGKAGVSQGHGGPRVCAGFIPVSDLHYTNICRIRDIIMYIVKSATHVV